MLLFGGISECRNWALLSSLISPLCSDLQMKFNNLSNEATHTISTHFRKLSNNRKRSEQSQITMWNPVIFNQMTHLHQPDDSCFSTRGFVDPEYYMFEKFGLKSHKQKHPQKVCLTMLECRHLVFDIKFFQWQWSIQNAQAESSGAQRLPVNNPI